MASSSLMLINIPISAEHTLREYETITAYLFLQIKNVKLLFQCAFAKFVGLIAFLVGKWCFHLNKHSGGSGLYLGK